MKTFTLLKSLNKGYNKYSFFSTLLLLCTSSFAQIIMNAPTLAPARWEAKVELLPVDNIGGGLKFIRTPILFTNPDTTRVGIGTDKPMGKIDIRGPIRFSDQSNFVSWQFKVEHSAIVGPYMTFRNTNADIFGSKNFVFLTAGNIGIGIDIPESKLDVNGDLKIRGNINANNLSLTGSVNAYALSLTGDITAANLSLSNNLTTKNLFVTEDFVAINLSLANNLTTKNLSVTGNLVAINAGFSGNISGNTLTTNTASFGSINANSLSLTGDLTATNLSLSNNLTTKDLTVTGNFNASNVNFSGNISGNTINGTNLIISGTSTFNQDLSVNGILKIGNSISLGSQTISGADQISTSSGQLDFLSTKIFNTGNIILGPQKFIKSERQSDGLVFNVIGVNGGNNDIEIGELTSKPTNVIIYTPIDANQGVRITNSKVNSKAIAFFRNDGYVGIGTTTPNAPLHITGLGNQYIDINSQSGTGNSYTRLMAVSSNNITESQLQYKGRFSFVEPLSGITKMIIDENGNVGIGTSSPQFKLDVCGSIRAKGIKINVDWCDFVFDKNYNLRTIPQLKTFIEQNGHLPNYPSGKEIEEQGGVEVSQSITWLLQSDEETKLYLIQMYEEIQELKKEKEAMKKEIEELKQKSK